MLPLWSDRKRPRIRDPVFGSVSVVETDFDSYKFAYRRGQADNISISLFLVNAFDHVRDNYMFAKEARIIYRTPAVSSTGKPSVDRTKYSYVIVKNILSSRRWWARARRTGTRRVSYSCWLFGLQRQARNPFRDNLCNPTPYPDSNPYPHPYCTVVRTSVGGCSPRNLENVFLPTLAVGSSLSTY